MSKDEKSFAKIPKEYQEKYRRHFGKVGLQFVCDRVDKFDLPYPAYFHSVPQETQDLIKNACLTMLETHHYIGTGKGYGLRISDLKIYDKPKELSEFKRWDRTEENSPCAHTKWLYPDCKDCKECNLTRPPQSWCYVED